MITTQTVSQKLLSIRYQAGKYLTCWGRSQVNKSLQTVIARIYQLDICYLLEFIYFGYNRNSAELNRYAKETFSMKLILYTILAFVAISLQACQFADDKITELADNGEQDVLNNKYMEADKKFEQIKNYILFSSFPKYLHKESYYWMASLFQNKKKFDLARKYHIQSYKYCSNKNDSATVSLNIVSSHIGSKNYSIADSLFNLIPAPKSDAKHFLQHQSMDCERKLNVSGPKAVYSCITKLINSNTSQPKRNISAFYYRLSQLAQDFNDIELSIQNLKQAIDFQKLDSVEYFTGHLDFLESSLNNLSVISGKEDALSQ